MRILAFWLSLVVMGAAVTCCAEKGRTLTIATPVVSTSMTAREVTPASSNGAAPAEILGVGAFDGAAWHSCSTPPSIVRPWKSAMHEFWRTVPRFERACEAETDDTRCDGPEGDATGTLRSSRDTESCVFEIARCHFEAGRLDRAIPLLHRLASRAAPASRIGIAAAVLTLDCLDGMGRTDPARAECYEVVATLTPTYFERHCRPFPEASDRDGSAGCTVLVKVIHDLERMSATPRYNE